jgi:hypothetical protein
LDSSPPTPVSSAYSELQSKKQIQSAIQTDTERLLSLHTTIWKIMRLSPFTIDELNELINKTNYHLQYNKYFHPDYYENNLGTEERSSGSKEAFDANHSRRFKQIGLSDAASSELQTVMNTLWRTLYDPNAYLDPSYDTVLSERLKILFEFGPPKCCSEQMYQRAKPQP